MPDDIKQRLIEAAGEAFAAKGYDAVGIREICQQAGANVAAINYHFGDKRELYVACLRHAQTCRIEDIEPSKWPTDMRPEDKLRAFIHGVLETKLSKLHPPWHMELMLREMGRPTDACQEIVEDFMRPMAVVLAGIMQELHPGSAWNQQAWLIGFSIVGQVLFYQVHQTVVRLLVGREGFDALTLDVLTDHITRFCLAAMGKGPAVTPDEPPTSEGAAP